MIAWFIPVKSTKQKVRNNENKIVIEKKRLIKHFLHCIQILKQMKISP